MLYEHTQRSPLWLIVSVTLLIGLALAGVAAEATAVVMILSAIGVGLFIAFIANFSVLTVTVEPTSVRAAFGRGFPRKTVDLGTVTAVRAVRNTWLYGWGIRWVPKGSLWNVWGLDAVELALDSGRVLRIGTDDPDGLLMALAGRLGSLPS